MHEAEIIVNDLFRHLFICLWMWTFLPAIFVGGSHLLTDGLAHNALEIRAFRLQHYEYGGGQQYGSKSWQVAYEAVALNGSALRKCLVIHWREIYTADGAVADLSTAFGAAVGAVLMVLPPNPATSGLSAAEKGFLLRLEERLAAIRTEQAVYFAHESPELTRLLSSSRRSSVEAPVHEQLLDTLIGDQYLITSSNQQSAATTATGTTKAFNLVAQLNAADKGRPYLVITAHYDSHSVVPALAQGADSNGSGVALLLELLAVLSSLLKSTRGTSVGRPKYNVVFLFSTGGKWSYQGTRQWIEDFNEKQPTDKVALTISLDGLAHTSGESGRSRDAEWGAGQESAVSLYAHVSKTPSNGSIPHTLLQHLNNFSPRGKAVQIVGKKINLAAERLAWEHEILNVRKIHALTLSHFSNHTDPMRSSLLDVRSSVDMGALNDNAGMVVNAVLSLLYGLDTTLCAGLDDSTPPDSCSILDAANGVNGDRLVAWMDMFATRARPIASADAMRPIIEDLKEVVKRYADRWELQEVSLNDFVLYGVIEDVLTAQIVKPAMFELLLSGFITVYLLAVYQLALKAQSLIDSLLTIRPLAKAGRKAH